MRCAAALAASLTILALAPSAASARTIRLACHGGAPPAATLRPGDRLLLRRGTVCRGTLAPTGGGTAARPVLIGAYGRGPRPRILAAGAPDALLLRDVSHVTVQDLELLNPGDGTTPRRGLHLVAEHGAMRGVTARRLLIHHVGGDLSKDQGGSGGIQADALGGGTATPGRFAALRIVDNRIADVTRSGIFVAGTTDASRPPAGTPWPLASTGVLIRGNRLTRLGGDGIVPVGTLGARVEDNVVTDGNLAGRALGDPRGMVCDAGIWTFHADGTVIRHNEVAHMRFNGCDGTGYDIDYDQDGTVVEGNYSHDNEGGFILLCTDTDPRHADVRFNLSIDDRFLMNSSPCSRPSGTLGGIRVYGNTVVAPDPALAVLGTRAAHLFGGAPLFADNVVVATTAGSAPPACDAVCSHNRYADPGFVHPSRRGPGRLRVGRAFRLRPGSPARRAGIALPAMGARDYFGVRVPTATAPNIGFDQRPAPRP